jgi:hypothetical protein
LNQSQSCRAAWVRGLAISFWRAEVQKRSTSVQTIILMILMKHKEMLYVIYRKIV